MSEESLHKEKLTRLMLADRQMSHIVIFRQIKRKSVQEAEINYLSYRVDVISALTKFWVFEVVTKCPLVTEKNIIVER